MKADALERLAWYLIAALMLLALAGFWRRERDLRARVVALENKACLMTGAHTGCKRIGAR